MRSLTIILLMILLVSATFMARAQVPRYISYQGLYTDTLGVPKPDGDYRFTFRFYADSVGGSVLFPPEVRVLKVKRGLFSVLLGGQPGFESVFSGPRWMSLQVDPDPEISRRIQLASTAYSFRSIRSDTALVALNAPLQQVADSARIAGTVPNNTITSIKIQDGTIQTIDVAANFKSPKADSADYVKNLPPIDSARIAGTVPNNSITSAKILDGTIQTVDVAPGFKSPDAAIADTVRRSPPTVVASGSIDSTKLATNAVVSSRIANGAVNAAKIASGQVVKGLNDVRDMVRIVGRRNATVNTSNDTLYIDAITGTTDTTGVRAIQNSNNTLDVTTSADRIVTINVKDQGIRTTQLGDASVTQAKLAPSVTLPPGGVAGGDLTGTYPNPTIATNAVTTSKIIDGAVTQTKIASGVTLPPGGAAGGDLTGTYPNPVIAPNTVTTGKIVDANVTGPKLADGAVNSAKILDGTIVRADVAPNFKAPDADIADTVRRAPPTVVAPGSIDSTKIATNAVVTSRIANGTITAVKIQAGQIVKGVNDLKDNVRLVGRGAASITSSNDTIYIETPPPTGGTGIQSLSNTNNTLTIVNPNGPNAIANVKDAGIGTLQLADGAVGTAKIADASVTQAKIASSVSFPPGGPAGGDLTGTYPNPTLALNTVTTGKILDGAVTQAKIAASVTLPPSGAAGGDLTGTYPNPALALNAVTTGKILDGAVTQAKIAASVTLPPSGAAGGDLAGTYPNPTLAASTVTTARIADGAVTQAKIAPGVSLPPSGGAGGDLTGTFPSPTIASNAVTTGKIVDGTILFQDIAQNGAAPGQVMKWTGTAWAPRADSLGSGGGVSGSGGVGEVPFWNAPTNLTSTNLFVWDNQNARLGIGAPSPQEKLDVNGTIRLKLAAGPGVPVVWDSVSGKLQRQGSSRKYKTNIRTLDIDPVKVLELNPVSFQWKSGGQEDIGLVAEEVNEAVQDLVIYDGEGRPDGVKYEKVAVYLLGVVKDQQKQIGQLQAAVKSLQGKTPIKSSLGELK